MRTWARIALVAVVCLLIGSLLPSPLKVLSRWLRTPRADIDSVVAMEWGDGQYGKRMYGACVFAVPTAAGVDVRAEVWIDDKDYWHDCGVIGTASDLRDAREKFGTIVFDGTGVNVGDGATMKLVAPKGTYDVHR